MRAWSFVSLGCRLLLLTGTSQMLTPIAVYARVCPSPEEILSCKDLTKFVLEADSESADRYASFEAAVNTTATRTLIISSPKTVTADTTVPTNVTLVFIGDGQLHPASEVTVTIDSSASGWPLRQIFGGSGAIVFSPRSPIGTVYPQWWGAADGTDSTDAFRKAYAACGGTGDKMDNRGRRLHIPTGKYTLSSKHVFRPKQAHRGVIVSGDGPYNTVLHYTYNAAEPDNFLIYHDRAIDGQAVDWGFRDLMVIGPGGLSNAGFCYIHSSTGGSGAIEMDNVHVYDMKRGFRITGSKADNDKYWLKKLFLNRVDECFFSDNSQSVWFTLQHCIFVTPVGSVDGSIFKIKAGGTWTVVGGGYAVQGASAVVRFTADYASVRSPLVFFGFHGELHDTAKLVSDDVIVNIDRGTRLRSAEFTGCQVNAFGTSPRNIAVLRDGCTMVVRGGVLNDGQIELISSEDQMGAAKLSPPRLIVEDAIWRKPKVIETFPAGKNALRPIVHLHRLGVDETIPEMHPDRDTGPMTQVSRGRITRPQKVLYLAQRSNTTLSYIIPGAGLGAVTATIPDGSNIVKIRLVMLSTYVGAEGTITVDNGEGTETYMTKSMATYEPAFVQEVDTTLILTEVSGQNTVVRLGSTGLSSAPVGYVEISYY